MLSGAGAAPPPAAAAAAAPCCPPPAPCPGPPPALCPGPPPPPAPAQPPPPPQFPQFHVRSSLQIKKNAIIDDYKVTTQVLGLGINGKVLQIFSKRTQEKFALKWHFPEPHGTHQPIPTRPSADTCARLCLPPPCHGGVSEYPTCEDPREMQAATSFPGSCRSSGLTERSWRGLGGES